MTEIYDVTDADTDVVQSPNERSVNKELEFDNDWSAELLADNGESYIKGSNFTSFVSSGAKFKSPA